MAVAIITQYQVYYFSNTGVPRITLFAGPEISAHLYFHPNGATLPPDGWENSRTRPLPIALLYYHRDDYTNILDLLRNEKPIHLYLGLKNAVLTTPELVGEEEV